MLDGFIYWTTYRGGSVARIPTGGGTPEVLAAQRGPFVDIVADAHRVLWTSQGAGTITAYSPGGSPVIVANALHGTPWSIASDGSSAYWTDWYKGAIAIERVAVVGGQSTVATVPVFEASCPGGGCFGGIATDGSYVYWAADEDNGSVRKVAVSGGDVVEVATAQPQPYGVAVDESCVYWTNFGDGTVMIGPK